MTESRSAPTIITFKADTSLVEAMQRIPNRSEFIRAAILMALDNLCPLCAGSGVLTANQMHHWQEFTRTHSLEECSDCHEVRVVCVDEELPEGAPE